MADNYVKFLRGTPSAYEALSKKDGDTLYFISGVDQKVGKLYLGDILVAGNVTEDGTSVLDSLGELTDVNLEGLQEKDFLGYNGTEWVPMGIEEAFSISVMTGASETSDGLEGLVPAPKAGDETKYLRGDGTWTEIETSSTTQVFEIEVDANADHVAAITSYVGETVLQNGDIAIVKELIANDKRQYTAYVYQDGDWVAMDGNYNAENVYFDEDITITTNVGNITVSNGNGFIPAAGKNLKQVFEAMYTKEDLDITVDWPSVSFSAGSNVNAEVGDTFTRPTATLKVTDIGSYEYGALNSSGAEQSKSATGITFNAMKVGFGTDNTTTTSMKNETDGGYGVNKSVAYTASTTDIPTTSVTDDTQTYKFYYKCDHTASPYKPKTNLGNLIVTGAWKDNNKTELKGTESGDISNFETALGQIEAKTLNSTTTFTVNGYRKWYTYVGDNMESIDSDWIRTNMTDKGTGKSINQNTLNLPVTNGTKRVVIAVPSGKITDMDKTIANYTARVKSCIDVDGMGLDIFAAGKIPNVTVPVNDKAGTNPMDYVVYVYENENGLAATTLKFTIN